LTLLLSVPSGVPLSFPLPALLPVLLRVPFSDLLSVPFGEPFPVPFLGRKKSLDSLSLRWGVTPLLEDSLSHLAPLIPVSIFS